MSDPAFRTIIGRIVSLGASSSGNFPVGDASGLIDESWLPDIPATNITYDDSAHSTGYTNVQDVIDYVLTLGGGGGSGDVVGPVSSTDNAVARFDSTTGKLLQNSAVTIDDSGNIATSGTVDGRDVSVDGTKLDGITSGLGSNNSITNAMIRDSSALSVIGRSANTTGDPADIAAGTDAHVLRRSGTTLGFGTLATASYSANSVTNAVLQTMAANTVKCNNTAATANATDLALTTWTLMGRAAANLVPVPFTSFTLTLLDDTDAATARTTLGLGTAATQATGTSGATLPFANGVNTWAGAQTFSAQFKASVGGLFGDDTTARSVGGTTGEVQVSDTSGSGSQLQVVRWTTGTNACPTIVGGKSNSGTIGTQAAVVADQRLFNIQAAGSDGTNIIAACDISFYVDTGAIVSTGIVPSRIVFSTANAAGSVTEALSVGSRQRVKASGIIGVGGMTNRIAGFTPASGTADTTIATVPANALSADGDELYIRIPVLFANNANTKRVRIGIDGSFGGTAQIADIPAAAYGSGAAAAVNGTLEIWCHRTSSSAIEASYRATVNGWTAGVIEDYVSGITWTATSSHTIELRSVGTAANDIVIRGTGVIVVGRKP